MVDNNPEEVNGPAVEEELLPNVDLVELRGFIPVNEPEDDGLTIAEDLEVDSKEDENSNLDEDVMEEDGELKELNDITEETLDDSELVKACEEPVVPV